MRYITCPKTQIEVSEIFKAKLLSKITNLEKDNATGQITFEDLKNTFKSDEEPEINFEMDTEGFMEQILTDLGYEVREC